MEYKLADNVSLVNSLTARNVIRRRRTFHYSQMANQMEEFIRQVEGAGGHLDGPILYSLNNKPDTDQIMDIEFFLPLQESYLVIEDSQFASYFEVNHCIATAVNHDYEELTKVAYAQLLWTLDMNNQDINTPFYHIVPTDGSEKMTVLLGYAY